VEETKRVKFDEKVRVREIQSAKEVNVNLKRQRVIERVKDDVFHDHEDLSSSSPPPPSSHQTRVAFIAQQIEKLEAENVRVGDKKEWSLMGEATSKNRPHNSLLEEDIDFDQLQRPISTVTAEFNISIQNLIKSRIIQVSPLISLSLSLISILIFPPESF
jgi:U3 small nucleolar ribonucleoprotein component